MRWYIVTSLERLGYEDSEDLLIIVFIVAHDGCHFYAAENFPNLMPTKIQNNY